MNILGVVGCGYWGPNLVRSFQEIDEVEVRYVCDRDPARLEALRRRFRQVRPTTRFEDLLEDPEVEALVISTPPASHHSLARRALEAGKHVFVEKPLAVSSAQCDDLVALARQKERLLMVDHTFVYTSAARKIKEILERGDLGEILYYDSVRINLGLYQDDVNVVWDLAVHDLSILDFLLGEQPASVWGLGVRQAGHKSEDVAYVTLLYPSGRVAHMHVNWLSPVKIRRILLGGSRRMLLWDDQLADEKLKIYERGVDWSQTDRARSLIQYRLGDTTSPHLEPVEALRVCSQHFIDCLRGGGSPLTDGEAGGRVVRILEAIDRSIARRGEQVAI
ncbi:MAG TPA: Gfo/Idh/MocA family oxidoreductase [Candidatus Nitrosotenuis sp.]|jgi:predicted dehydrogenase|nr:Gfo/Idh/MocA family oxidoreductase [Candidatus Nitrosotenuis sp.]